MFEVKDIQVREKAVRNFKGDHTDIVIELLNLLHDWDPDALKDEYPHFCVGTAEVTFIVTGEMRFTDDPEDAESELRDEIENALSHFNMEVSTDR